MNNFSNRGPKAGVIDQAFHTIIYQIIYEL